MHKLPTYPYLCTYIWANFFSCLRTEREKGGSLYEAMKAVEQTEKDDTAMEEIGGFLSEKEIEEVMMNAGLIDDGKGFAGGVKTEVVVLLQSFLDDFAEIEFVSGDFGDAVAAVSENLFASLISREGADLQWVTSASCWRRAAALEEEKPMRGWIWYPYTDEELKLRSFEEDKVIWEYALWNWDDKHRVPAAVHPLN